MHNPEKVLLGSHGSSAIVADCEGADPATFKAGLVVRRPTSGGLSLTSGSPIGISLGRSLSDHLKTAVARSGNLIPVLILDEGVAASLEVGDLTFTGPASAAANSITIALTAGATAGSEVVTVTDSDIVIQIADGASTATQIKAKFDLSEEAAALGVTVAIAAGQDAVAQDVAAEAPLADGADPFPYVEKGSYVEFGADGKACSSGTATQAFYVSGPIKGIDPITKEEFDCAIVDMPGGL